MFNLPTRPEFFLFLPDRWLILNRYLHSINTDRADSRTIGENTFSLMRDKKKKKCNDCYGQPVAARKEQR